MNNEMVGYLVRLLDKHLGPEIRAVVWATNWYFWRHYRSLGTKVSCSERDVTGIPIAVMYNVDKI